MDLGWKLTSQPGTQLLDNLMPIPSRLTQPRRSRLAESMSEGSPAVPGLLASRLVRLDAEADSAEARRIEKPEDESRN